MNENLTESPRDITRISGSNIYVILWKNKHHTDNSYPLQNQICVQSSVLQERGASKDENKEKMFKKLSLQSSTRPI
ncbi:hypothetical protein ACJIZ3_004128 [Penstemon smallii]|uniref:Uncharacterized protein n=1 Tax=Penstemon smallii TaxID=265156 RepID=A0ABD3S171_9LAMI